jgi:hypothetical protein
MPKPILWRPFQKLNRSDEPRLQPPAMLHIVRGESLSPASLAALRKIHKRAFRDRQTARTLNQFHQRQQPLPMLSQPASQRPLIAANNLSWTDVGGFYERH